MGRRREEEGQGEGGEGGREVEERKRGLGREGGRDGDSRERQRFDPDVTQIVSKY